MLHASLSCTRFRYLQPELSATGVCSVLRQDYTQVRGYLPLDPNVAPTPQVTAASQALKLQELALRKQELLFELQGYQVSRATGQTTDAVQSSGHVNTCNHTCKVWSHAIALSSCVPKEKQQCMHGGWMDL